MLYLRPCKYVLRALTYISLHSDSGLCRTKKIAESENIPAPFLAKLLLRLVRSGLLVSAKGPKGGFGLARPSKEIPLIEIVSVVDGEDQFTRCALGLVQCSDDFPCSLHDTWQPLREKIINYLSVVTLADFAEAHARKKQLSLPSMEIKRRFPRKQRGRS